MGLEMSPRKAREASDLTFTFKEANGSATQQTILRASTYKLFSVLLDEKLRWHRHHELDRSYPSRAMDSPL